VLVRSKEWNASTYFAGFYTIQIWLPSIQIRPWILVGKTLWTSQMFPLTVHSHCQFHPVKLVSLHSILLLCHPYVSSPTFLSILSTLAIRFSMKSHSRLSTWSWSRVDSRWELETSMIFICFEIQIKIWISNSSAYLGWIIILCGWYTFLFGSSL